MTRGRANCIFKSRATHLCFHIFMENRMASVVILLMPKPSSEKLFNDQTHKSRVVDFVAIKSLRIWFLQMGHFPANFPIKHSQNATRRSSVTEHVSCACMACVCSCQGSPRRYEQEGSRCQQNKSFICFGLIFPLCWQIGFRGKWHMVCVCVCLWKKERQKQCQRGLICFCAQFHIHVFERVVVLAHDSRGRKSLISPGELNSVTCSSVRELKTVNACQLRSAFNGASVEITEITSARLSLLVRVSVQSGTTWLQHCRRQPVIYPQLSLTLLSFAPVCPKDAASDKALHLAN